MDLPDPQRPVPTEAPDSADLPLGLSGPQADHLQRLMNLDALLDRPLTVLRHLAPRRPLGREGLLLGKYRLVTRIDSGGFGEVWQAEHHQFAEAGGPAGARAVPTCLKLLDPHRTQSKDVLAEARAMASIRHENVVPVRDSGTVTAADGTTVHFIEMELVGEFDPRGEFELARSLQSVGARDGRPAMSAREAAAMVAATCRGVDAAHRRGRIHCDLKPGNVLVEPFSRRPKVIDFGIARAVGGEPAGPDGAAGCAARVAGTPAYMAPEQAHGDVTQRSDIYGLGAILYFLLTGGPPYVDLIDGPSQTVVRAFDQLKQGLPPRPFPRETRIPRTLKRICQKAMAREPSRRYAGTEEMARDLEAFLAGRPTQADPPGKARRAALWCARNRLATTALAVIVVTVAATWAHGERRQRRAEQFQTLVRKHEAARGGARTMDWSLNAMEPLATAAAMRADPALRDYAAASLAGLDASYSTKLDGSGSSITFSADSRRLVVGGVVDRAGQHGAFVNDLNSGLQTRCGITDPGPGAFLADGTPVVLTVAGERLTLFKITNGEPLVHYDTGAAKPVTWAMTAEGRDVAAVVAAADGRRTVLAWDGATAERRHTLDLPGVLPADGDECLALSADGKVTAYSHGRRVAVWSGADLVYNQPWDDPVKVLAFGPRNSVPRLAPEAVPVDWLLAVANTTGTIEIIDLGTGRTRAILSGSEHAVYAMAFSPDGTLLASGGRNCAKLWDAATGRFLLELDTADFTTGIAFSPDGRSVAVSTEQVWNPGRVNVYHLQNGRGTQSLRGLRARVMKVAMSADGRRVAALAQDWSVGVWDRQSGALLSVVPGPIGLTGDNSGVALSADGSRLALSAGTGAALWDLTSRPPARLGSWQLPFGLVDVIGFHPSGQVVLFRSDGQGQEPRVCRIRALPEGGEPRVLAELDCFNAGLHGADAPADVSFFVAEGVHRTPEGSDRSLKKFDALTGEVLRSWELHKQAQFGPVSVAPYGKEVVYFRGDAGDSLVVLDADSGAEQVLARPHPTDFGPPGYWVRSGLYEPTPGGGLLLVRRGERPEPVVRLGMDETVSSFNAATDTAGRYLAWGNADGTVSVCDLAETRKRLDMLGLDWEAPPR